MGKACLPRKSDLKIIFKSSNIEYWILWEMHNSLSHHQTGSLFFVDERNKIIVAFFAFWFNNNRKAFFLQVRLISTDAKTVTNRFMCNRQSSIKFLLTCWLFLYFLSCRIWMYLFICWSTHTCACVCVDTLS